MQKLDAFVRCAALGLFLCMTGCFGGGPPRVVPERVDADAAAKAIELYDANHDGFLDKKEAEKAAGLNAAFERLDTGHRGKISQEDIASRIKSWGDSRTGRTPVRCRVTHNGVPLVGAKVVFVPESFLGSMLRSGSGATMDNGGAIISSAYDADPSVQGLSPGFYRVEITKDGENIPAKYNSQTVLGAEASSDDIGEGMNFELQY